MTFTDDDLKSLEKRVPTDKLARALLLMLLAEEWNNESPPDEYLLRHRQSSLRKPLDGELAAQRVTRIVASKALLHVTPVGVAAVATEAREILEELEKALSLVHLRIGSGASVRFRDSDFQRELVISETRARLLLAWMSELGLTRTASGSSDFGMARVTEVHMGVQATNADSILDAFRLLLPTPPSFSPSPPSSRSQGPARASRSTGGPMELKNGLIIDHWKLEKPLGSPGGQAHVWQVSYTKEKHSPKRAMKICKTTDKKAKDRFAEELKLLKTTSSHQHLVQVIDSGEYAGHPHFVMECATTTLGAAEQRATPGNNVLRESPGLLLKLFTQACEGVAHLHAHQVIHRDLKPSNILLMLDPREAIRAVVSDLGISSLDHEQGKLTEAHEILGTQGYRAPEVSAGGPHTYASDVYSLGKVLETLFAIGQPAIVGASKCTRHAALSDALWDALDRILSKACALDPNHRYSNAQALRDAMPTPVLAIAGQPRPQPSSAQDIVLAEREIVALGEIMAKELTGHMPPHAFVRNSSLSDLDASLAVRSLRRRGFIDVVEEKEEDGLLYEVLIATDEAYLWAETHEEELRTISRPTGPPYEDAVVSSDDIPF